MAMKYIMLYYAILYNIILYIGIPVLLKSDKESRPFPYGFIFLFDHGLRDKGVRVRYQTVNLDSERWWAQGKRTDGSLACFPLRSHPLALHSSSLGF